MAATLVSNGDLVAGKAAPATGRVASVYSEVQASRIDHALPLPSVLRSPFKVVDGPPSSAAGNPGHFLLLHCIDHIREFSLVNRLWYASICFESCDLRLVIENIAGKSEKFGSLIFYFSC